MNRALRRQQKKLSKKAAKGNSNSAEILQQGIQFHTANDFAKAEECYELVLTVEPNNAEANHLLGTLLHQKGSNEVALNFLQKAVEINPANPNFYNILGLALKNIGKPNDAIKAFEAAVQVDPKFAPAFNSLGIIHKDMGSLAKAIAAATKAVEIAPITAENFNTLGSAYESAAEFSKAIEAYKKGLELDPNFLILQYNMGNAYYKSGQIETAAKIFEFVIARQPEFAAAQSNYGLMLRKLGRHAEAVVPIQKACELEPANAERYYNLGLALASVGQSSDAVACFEGTLSINPDHQTAYSDHGLALLAMGRSGDAVSSLEKAVMRNADSDGIQNNLGQAYLRDGQLEKAKHTIAKALTLNSDYVLAYNNLGVVHQELAEFPQAHKMFERALELEPNYVQAMSNMLFTLNYDPDKSGKEIFKSYKAYNKTFAEPLAAEQRPHDNEADTEKRIKIGYVAPTFYNHSVTPFLMPLFDNCSHDQFEVFAYADLTKSDKYTEQYKSNSDHFILTTGMSDEDLAERVREDKIDILVDIAGHAKGSRLPVFARKPAPVSIHWLDFGYTTGMPAIDYYLGDPNTTPEDQDHLFGENEVWRVDGPSFVYRPNPNMGEVSSSPAVRNGFVTFCSLSRSVRMNDKTLRVWSEILKAVPKSKLRLDSRNFKDETMCDSITAKFHNLGVEADRLILGFSSPPFDTLREVDIAFDCFPHNSGTTLYEHLYMGNPYVTLANRASVGRLGATILRGGGFGEWVAETEEEYVDIAVRLASDIPALAEIRSNLRSRFEQSAMMDESAFIDRFERAYREMWQRWCMTQ